MVRPWLAQPPAQPLAESPAESDAAARAPAPARTLRLGGRDYPLILPSWRDPRLHLAAVIVSLQVLGQTVLHFELSIAQILVSILTCAVLEVGITFGRRRILLWPASALLTGNGVAFILRVPGTIPGDRWSLRGAWLYALCAAIALLSKYVIRRGGRHIFNPSNLGLVVVFLVFRTRVVNPQDLWWGPLSPGLLLTLAVIVAGGLSITRRLRILGMVLAFWVTFAALIGLLAASGHCMTARWHIGPVCGQSFWGVLALSPEILVFLFFMITDPRTSPAGRVGRLLYGAGVAVVAALLAAPATTEFWTKVAVLGALALVCALRPVLEPHLPAPGSDHDRPGVWIASLPGTMGAKVGVAAGVAAVILGGLFAAGVPARRAAAAPRTGPVTRPAVVVHPSDIPPVSIGTSVGKIQVSVTPALAHRMAEDLIVDLIIEGDAIRGRNEALAATAASGRALGIVRHEIEVADHQRVTPPPHTFAALTVVAVKDPLRPQDPARLGIAAQGSGSRTYALTLAGDHYLITMEVAP